MDYNRLSPERIKKAISEKNKYGLIITKEEAYMIADFFYELARAGSYERSYDSIAYDLSIYIREEM